MSAARGSAARVPESSAGTDAVLRALADPHRRSMLRLVRDGELAAGQIATHFDITQQAVSHHLHVLRRAGLLEERREGTRHLFVLRPQALDPVRDLLADFWPEALGRLKTAVETNRRRTGEPTSP